MNEKRITQELLDKLQTWVKGGSRAFSVKSDSYFKRENTVWVYDYDMAAGIHLALDDSAENLTERIRADKRERLLKELEAS